MDTFERTCILEVYHESNQDVKPSCSGIILDSVHGIIVSHGSLIWPVLNSNHKLKLTENGQLTIEELNQYSVNVIAKVSYHSRIPEQTKEMHMKYSNTSTSRRRHPKTESGKQVKVAQGKVNAIWKAALFEETLVKIVPASDGWKFAEDSKAAAKVADKKSSDITENGDKAQHSFNHRQDDHNGYENGSEMLPFFVLVKFNPNLEDDFEHLNIYNPLQLEIGDRVYVVATPFGSLSPAVFMNSVSEGVISNMTGVQQELILTDARAIPGSEGGALYTKDGDIFGMVVAPLCWKSNEWIGLTICCSFHALISSLPQNNTTVQEIQLHRGRLLSQDLKALPAPLKPSIDRVVLVRCGGSWGSGVIVDTHLGLVITCSHVVRSGPTNRVKLVQSRSIRHTLWASVVYASQPGEVYDIAVLRLNQPRKKHVGQSSRYPPVRKPCRGEVVYAVGHACFPEQLRLHPSITRGVVSKVIHCLSKPVIIQSSCAVHAGASGGPLIGKDGSLIGIIACNAKDTISGSSYPHINMSIPFSTVWDTIMKYISTGDVRELNGLSVSQKQVKALWNLKDDLPDLCSKI